MVLNSEVLTEVGVCRLSATAARALSDAPPGTLHRGHLGVDDHFMATTSGGASASGQGADLRGRAASARAARQAGAKVVRGSSETALRKQAKAWDAGARGEGRAARQLDRLRREGFTTLNDVLLDPAKAWNLDHVVIGPPGVLFVDAKNWRGRCRVARGVLWRNWYGGPKTGAQSEAMTREVAKVKGMAARAAERLGVPVIPVICLAGGESRAFEGVAVVKGVRVVGLDGLVAWLRESAVVLSEAQVRRLVEVARVTFPPAVVEDVTDPVVRERLAWEQAMRSGGAPSNAARAGVGGGAGAESASVVSLNGDVDRQGASVGGVRVVSAIEAASVTGGEPQAGRGGGGLLGRWRRGR